MEPTFLESLQQHRADALLQRDRFDERIRALDVLIAQESKFPMPSAGQVSGSGRFGTGGSVTLASLPLPAAVTQALEGHGGALNFPDLHAAVSQLQGQEVNEKSLRGTLPRMEREGKLIKPQRGVYALPTHADSPAADAAGLSDQSDQVPEGGEYTDGQGSHHDHRVDLGGRNGDRDDLGAPVGH